MKKIIYIIISITCFCSCSNDNIDDIVDKNKLLAVDIRLFQQSEVWNIAKAIYNNDKHEVIQLLRKGNININYQEPIYGRTLLMFAVTSHKYDFVEILLQNGANVNLRDYSDGATAIIDAVDFDSNFGNQTKILKLLVNYGANINDVEGLIIRDTKHERFTPLSKACRMGKEEIVKFLLSKGANVNYISETNTFALGEAAVQGRYGLVLLLLSHDADPTPVILERPNGQKIRLTDLLDEYEREGFLLPWHKTQLHKIREIIARYKH